ncbi:MAG: SDR family oxidoreductase [Parasphingorhabdus sp.]
MTAGPLDAARLFSLAGRTALVTGSSRGIGASIARCYSENGARVVVHGTRPHSADAMRDTIGPGAVALDGDLAERGAGRRLLDAAEAAAGPVDILVINASAQVNGAFEDVSDDAFDLQMHVNVRSTFELLQTVLPRMAARGWGRVVNVGSINQQQPKPIVSIYAATKAATHNLVQSLAREYAAKGVLLNTLAPGLVDTDRNADRRNADPAAWDGYVATLNHMGRAAHADEMAGAALYLASDACSFMTGETIFVTGGY